MRTVLEEWRPVCLDGFENSYEVSNLGRVRVSSSRPPNPYGKAQKRPLELLSPNGNGTGYLQVDLHSGNLRKRPTIHRLVAHAFLGDPPEKNMEINHKDCNKQNNDVSNLEWVTRSANSKHALYNNRNPSQKLTHEKVEAIRLLISNGYNNCKIGRIFGVTDVLISKIKNGKAWVA